MTVFANVAMASSSVNALVAETERRVNQV